MKFSNVQLDGIFLHSWNMAVAPDDIITARTARKAAATVILIAAGGGTSR